jgi:transposase-like protein
MPRKPIHDDATFIRAYMACENRVQLARRLGIDKAAVYARVKKLLAEGVNLPPQKVAP